MKRILIAIVLAPVLWPATALGIKLVIEAAYQLTKDDPR